MLKREIKFKDFNDNDATETAYFHMTKTEWLELEATYPKGIEGTMLELTRNNDRRGMFRVFQDLVLNSYGEKEEDGRHFNKSEAISNRFKQSAAYDALFIEIFSSEQNAVDFLKGLFPADMRAEIERVELQQKFQAAQTPEHVPQHVHPSPLPPLPPSN